VDILDKNVNKKVLHWVWIITGNILIIAVILFVIEGLASYSLFARDVMTAIPLAERRHTQYDPDLGWSNIPDVDIPDMYSPGIPLRTNSQGFRNDHDFDKSVPVGYKRIICSGDSFTLGYGVGNDHTWCQRLSALNPRLETVNMGQGGYGVDQAYLWYMRDGRVLEHDIHVFAFITDDLFRMQRNQYLGYGKPVLMVENDELLVRNTPVPRASYIFSMFTSRIESFNKLRTVEFAKKAMQKIQTSPGATVQQDTGRKQTYIQDVLQQILKKLKDANAERNSQLVLVYLPTRYELKAVSHEKWINLVEQLAAELDIPLINVLESFRAMDYKDAQDMFISSEESSYPGASLHLGRSGNDMVAGIINEWIEKNLLTGK
jgi:lysophospholipase L1-like esterase